ncbi:hypothetical protein [Sphingomonas sp. Ant20]|uniref:hypothetical protein n=1 Tax=Sphingomonas sp. Ant20 TaxID=104605 RepID=UPI000A4D9F45
MFELVPLNAVPDAEVEALLDRAFGQDRHGRTAYMIRGDGTAIPTLSFAAVSGDMLLGSIQCWPIALMTAQAALPLVMVARSRSRRAIRATASAGRW